MTLSNPFLPLCSILSDSSLALTSYKILSALNMFAMLRHECCRNYVEIVTVFASFWSRNVQKMAGNFGTKIQFQPGEFSMVAKVFAGDAIQQRIQQVLILLHRKLSKYLSIISVWFISFFKGSYVKSTKYFPKMGTFYHFQKGEESELQEYTPQVCTCGQRNLIRHPKFFSGRSSINFLLDRPLFLAETYSS